jgi:tetratricopeptide (TPR) repeat protein
MRRGPLGPPIAAILALVLFAPAYRDFRGFHYLGEYRRARSEARNIESAFPTLEALLEKAVNASPRSEFRIELARLYTEMARVANDSGREEDREAFCDRAVSAYERAIAANPAHAFTYYETGLVYLLSNYPLMTYADRAKTYFRKALELFRRAVALKPDYAEAYYNMGVAYGTQGKWAEAIAAYRQDLMDELLGFDGEEEFTVYLAPVGKVRS